MRLSTTSLGTIVTLTEDIIKAQKIVKQSHRIVVFSGAGISTESGIPDFRSPGGLWTKYDPSIYANYQKFLHNPEKFWEMQREVTPLLENALPNPAHFACVELENQERLLAIITQNIDYLHQRAGIKKTPIFELHGTGFRAHCVKCRYSISREELLEKIKTEPIPRCDKCGGLVKPSVVLFGEELPQEDFSSAQQAAQDCDLVIVVGSSLQVYPANCIPGIAKDVGAKIIIIDQYGTDFDAMADVVLIGMAGELFPQIVK